MASNNRNILSHILEAGGSGLKSRCQQGHVPSEGSKEGSRPAFSSFWQPEMYLGLWLHNSNFSLPVSSHGSCLISVCPFLFPLGTLIGFGDHSNLV